jgi:endonuclease/exonuclease/phosphatase family metal-dependent hydrolase
LPTKHAVLATEAEQGRAFYADDEQKVGLIMSERFTVERARLILTDRVLDFAGRPPLEVQLSFEEAGQARTLVVIVVHLKASEDKTSYNLRLRSAQALKDYLNTEHPTRGVAVIGDFNDDLTSSITYLEWSPFRLLQDEPEKLRFVTKPLSDARESTTVGYGRPIDHHLVTNELAAHYIEGSARVLRLDKAIARYGETTSDHFPVLSRYDLR